VAASAMRFERVDLTTGILGIIGLAISIYLTIVHYQEHLLVCAVGGGGCETVQTSKYATIGSIPIALLGIGMYVAILGLIVARRYQPEWAFAATTAIFGITLAGVLYEIYLTYVEIWVIDAICPWCVTFAIVTLLIMIVEGWHVWQLVNE
jgi:uncharacterized membrane protein